MKIAYVAAALLLAGCGGPSLSENQQAEVRDIADDVSDANDAALRSRIDELEARLESQSN
jgi:outer membrane murein-binding lipoprotein Lpp